MDTEIEKYKRKIGLFVFGYAAFIVTCFFVIMTALLCAGTIAAVRMVYNALM